MEDDNKVKKILTYIKIIIIFTIIICIGIFAFIKIENKINNNNLYNYLNKNNYKTNEDKIYYKKIDESITEKALSNDYIFSKEIRKQNEKTSVTILNYKKDNSIFISYQEDGFDNNGNYGISYQEGTYKNKKFKCKIITNNNQTQQCSTMKTQAENYYKEIQDILNNNKINLKFVNIKTKNAKKN